MKRISARTLRENPQYRDVMHPESRWIGLRYQRGPAPPMARRQGDCLTNSPFVWRKAKIMMVKREGQMDQPARQDKFSAGNVAAYSGRHSVIRALLGARLFDWLRVVIRVRKDFARLHGYSPAILLPRRYTEKMQWRKLFDLNPHYAILSDKLAARDFIASRIGAGHTADLLWSGADPALIPFDLLDPPYVIKSNHGCGHMVMVPDATSVDRAHIFQVAKGWLDESYGDRTSEPGYVHIPRRIMIERLIAGHEGAKPLEHRAFVFAGKVRVIQTSRVVDGKARNAGFRTPDWHPLGWRLISALDEQSIPRPAKLDALIAAAETLGVGLSHVRVDFYESGDDIIVGELTLYSWSGVVPFHPDSADFELGNYWEIRWPALTALWAIAFRAHEIRPPATRTRLRSRLQTVGRAAFRGG